MVTPKYLVSLTVESGAMNGIATIDDLPFICDPEYLTLVQIEGH